MASSFDAVVSSWPAQPGLAISLLITAAIYLRGWLVLRRRDPSRWNFGRLAAFTTGLGMLYLAMASPIEAFAALLLQVHMVQHLLLMMVAPPLVWLGAPMLPLLHGVPIEVRRYWIVPLIHWRPLRQVMAAIAHPLGALIVIIAATWIWHFPTLYQMALANDNWHIVQHICFFTAGLIFWHAVIRPFPARPSWPTWLLVPLLLLADIQNTIFSALLTFSSGIWYPHYAAMPRIGGISAIDDQAAAGVTMWVPGSIAFLLPLAWIGLGLLFPARGHNSRMRPPNRATVVHDHRALDLLRVALLGRVLRWSWTRRIVQSLVLLAAIAVIVDGLGGPQIAPMNLAGVVPWIHWRGLVVIGLLIAGNVFCYGCPFTLPRTIARKLFGGLAQFDWPKRLRTKWLAVALLVVFLWSYEAFSLWDSPWLTAWIAIAYFVGALVIDSIFREAAFCKFVCPIGQFNFVQSLISPLEVKVREPAICTTCRTHDCIRGRTTNQLQILPAVSCNFFSREKSAIWIALFVSIACRLARMKISA